jgi:uncharacterized protein YecA (UPF0149 family)
LFDDDASVREAAWEYFRGSWSNDPELIPLALDAAERFGKEEEINGIGYLNRFRYTEESLDRVLDFLTRTEDKLAILNLNRELAEVPGDLLAGRLAEILAHPRLDPTKAPLIQFRAELNERTGEQLWAELQDYAVKSEDVNFVKEIDHNYVDALVDALSRRDVPDNATICELLRSLQPDEGWLEIFLVDLAGARRIHQAIPALVDKLHIDSDYLPQQAGIALLKIGDPEAIRLIREVYPTANESFKNYCFEVLAGIKDQESEDAILEFLESDSNSEISLRTFLCLALCEQFSERGIEVVKRQIAEGYDHFIDSLEDQLIAVAKILGVDLPEAEQWRKREEERRFEMIERIKAFERTLLSYKMQNLEPAYKLTKADPIPGPPPRSSIGTIRKPAMKVGRNDPCPCGSGKKSKKCCGNG